MTTANKDLQVLQGKLEGDINEAAGNLGSHIMDIKDKLHRTLPSHVNDVGALADWFEEGDYDGTETINSLLDELNELR